MDTLLGQVTQIKSIKEACALFFSYITKTEAINSALKLSISAHNNQYRKSGEPYVVHPIIVACFVANLSADESMIIASLLHDIIEDTSLSLQTIEKNYGADVAYLVDGVTKIDEIRDQKLIPSDAKVALTKSALNFRKILLASTKDIRVLVVKLCDRMHNMLTLDALDVNKQKRIAEETMIVYVPIAHRLGISLLKRELEDLSFKALFPNDYANIESFVKSHKYDFFNILNNFVKDIKSLLQKENFVENEFQLLSRVKHHYSTYIKLQRKGIDVEEVLDLLAVRIIVKEPIDAYRAIGVIHLHFKPLMTRFKDYISVPKENGYQTIHTTVFYNRSIIEVQVRTFEMHHTAELGVAAHWKYKTDGIAINLDWLTDLSKQGENVEIFMELAKKDLFSEDIVVYSPQGDSFTLPRGSVALDFAYAIHTDIGNKAEIVYINKHKKNLLTELKNGDIVNIEKSEKLNIRCTWVDTVKTSKARHYLLHHCNIRNKEINIVVAINILATALYIKKDTMISWLKASNFVNNFYMAAEDITYIKQIRSAYLESLNVNHHRFRSFLPRKRFKLKEINIGYVKVASYQYISDVSFNYCCHPKKGDKIIAFKEGTTIKIHHKMCDKALARIEQECSMVHITWNEKKIYKYRLIVSLISSKVALAKFLLFLAKMGVDVLSIELGNKREGNIQYCTITFEKKDDNITDFRKKIGKKMNIIEFVSTDDIYKN